jgi:acetyltransferase-like isoleucine patch superfamily enzyme
MLRLSALFTRGSLMYHRAKTAVFYRLFFRSIGSGSRIIRPILLLNTEFASLGVGVTIRNGARIELAPDEASPSPALIIGDYTNIEQNIHIACRYRIQIGSNVSITANCAIVDVTHPYENVNDHRKIGARIELVDRPVEIGDGTFIGMNSLILPGSKIGRYCMIGAGSIVNGIIPDYSVALGCPARIIKRYDPDLRKWQTVK